MKTLIIGIIPALAFIISCSKPLNNDVLIKKAHSHYLNGDFAKAENYALESLKENSGLKEAKILLARIYFKNSRDVEFQKIIKSITDKDQFDINALRLNSLWLVKQKKYDDARENLNRILSISEDDLSALYLSGSICRINGDINGAVKYYTTALKSYVLLKNIHNNLGEIYSKLDLKDRESDNNSIIDAITKFEESLK
jgi:tetratricopeptide (TPR) repeat protein